MSKPPRDTSSYKIEKQTFYAHKLSYQDQEIGSGLIGDRQNQEVGVRSSKSCADSHKDKEKK
jgi:hypothetical protein